MSTLKFKNVEIVRARGIRRGEGFKLENLAGGVNLVHGPNGSGKTTTMLALQELLWPTRTGLKRATLSADLASESDRIRVEIEAGHAVCTRNGAPIDAPQSSPREMRKRYRLALHELLTAEDVDFAQTIVTESQGGIDVARIAQELGFSESLPTGRAE